MAGLSLAFPSLSSAPSSPCMLSSNPNSPQSRLFIHPLISRTTFPVLSAASCIHNSPSTFNSDLYDVLGIHEDATPLQIKKAFRQKTLMYHPDVCIDLGKEESARMFMAVKDAYNILSHPHLRAHYDLTNTSPSNSHQGFSRTHSTRGKQSSVYVQHDASSTWKLQWESQLNKLKQWRSSYGRSTDNTWGARMRHKHFA